MRRPPPTPLRPFALFRARLRLRHRPLLWWACVLALAAAVAFVATSQVDRARADARRCVAVVAGRSPTHRPVLPPGTRALAVPTGPGALSLRPGDRVDVLATFDPMVAPPGRDPTETVARAATVVTARRGGVTVAVAEAEVDDVALALSQAVITLALTPPGTVGARD